MKIKEAIGILKQHNKWRRGDKDIEMVSPYLLGLAIDWVVAYFEELDN